MSSFVQGNDSASAEGERIESVAEFGAVDHSVSVFVELLDHLLLGETLGLESEEDPLEDGEDLLFESARGLRARFLIQDHRLRKRPLLLELGQTEILKALQLFHKDLFLDFARVAVIDVIVELLQVVRREFYIQRLHQEDELLPREGLEPRLDEVGDSLTDAQVVRTEVPQDLVNAHCHQRRGLPDCGVHLDFLFP